MIDPSCPFDKGTEQKEEEGLSNYDTLKFELTKLRNLNVTIISVVVGVVGEINERMEAWIQKIVIGFYSGNAAEMIIDE